MCYFQITLYVNSCQQCPPVELMRDLRCLLRTPHRDKLHYMLSQHERAAVQRLLLISTLKGNPDPPCPMAAVSLSHLSVERREHRVACSWLVMVGHRAFISTSLRRCSKCYVGSSLLCEAGEGRRMSLDVHCCQTTCGSAGRL